MTAAGDRGEQEALRIAVIAYEFPPSPSPQSLRWAYLTRELARLGHRVHVIAPATSRTGEGLPVMDEGVSIERVFPGPFAALLDFLAQRRHAALLADPPASDAAGDAATGFPDAVGLNWKGRAAERVKALLGCVMFPDARAEWGPWLKRATQKMVKDFRPDVVVTSHEPASVLGMGATLARAGVPWVADLGDPVLAPYTPRRWHRRAFNREAAVCRDADAIVVTAASARELLAGRHGAGERKCFVVTQGFDSAPATTGEAWSAQLGADPTCLDLLYTGRFYRFRSPVALLEAVARTPGVRLNVASPSLPDPLLAWGRSNPAQFRSYGFVRHRRALGLQRCADLLVTIGNDQASQVPGKLYEYLGSRRPILHLGANGADVSANFVEEAGVGWACENQVDAIAAMLVSLRDDKRAGKLGGELQRNDPLISVHGWPRLAQSYAQILRMAAGRGHGVIKAGDYS